MPKYHTAPMYQPIFLENSSRLTVRLLASARGVDPAGMVQQLPEGNLPRCGRRKQIAGIVLPRNHDRVREFRENTLRACRV